MKHRLITHIVWALVAIIAFLVGYVEDASKSTQTNISQSVAPANCTATTETRESTQLETKTATVLSGEQIRVLTFNLLSEPNRLVRMRKLYALLEYVTQDNWHDVIDAFKRQTTSEARINTNELHLVMERVGEVAGADAIAEALSSTNPAEKNRVGEILAGWAESDPKASLAWFQGQQPEMQKQFLQLFLDGVSQSDPRQALSLVMSQPQDVQEKIIPIIVENAVQHGGFREAEALLSPLIGRADIDDGTRGKVFSKLAHRRIAVGAVTGDPFEALNWFANYFGPQSPAGPMATTAIVWNAAVKDPNATLHWLEERSVQRGSSAGGIAYPIVAQALVQQSPEQFNAWMNAHADHPQHDSMVEAATGIFLRKGKLEEAGQWAATVSSPEIRAKIDAAIQKASSRPQTAKPADLK